MNNNKKLMIIYITNLNNEIKEIKRTLKNIEVGSEEWKNLRSRFEDLRRELKQLQNNYL